MSNVDVDSVNERLNGLVSLLKAVGVDGNHRKSLDEDQITAIIQKLQLAQAEAPQIIAALEAQAKLKHKKPPEPEPEEEEDSDDDDANYPMVGHGCSDEISVVSDLTTPTVVSSLHVPEEEHYRESLPPMLIAPKKKNLVSSVTKRRPGHGAAAQRRMQYNAAMDKLSKGHGGGDNTHAVQHANPKNQPTIKKQPKLKKKPKQPTTTSRRASVDMGWQAFDSKPSPQSKMQNSTATLIDDDGFLTSDFDPFSNPFPTDPFNSNSSQSSSPKKSSKKPSSKPRKSRRASLAM